MQKSTVVKSFKKKDKAKKEDLENAGLIWDESLGSPEGIQKWTSKDGDRGVIFDSEKNEILEVLP